MTDELVRVRIKTDDGVLETNLGREFADATEGVEVLDEPATDSFGVPLPETRADGRPRKPKTTVADAAAKKKAAVSPAQSAEEATA